MQCMLRLTSLRNGSVIFSHVKAAINLTSLKTVSVCNKLDLNAALLSARLVRFLEDALSKKISGRNF